MTNKISQNSSNPIDQIAKAFAYISGFFILVIFITLISEIASRYIIGKSLIWSYPIATIANIVVAFSAIVYAESKDSHIFVSILADYLNDQSKKAWKIVTTAISLLFVTNFAIWTVKSGLNSFAIRETSYGVWSPIIYPVKLFMGVCLIFLTIQILSKLILIIKDYRFSPKDIDRKIIILAAVFIFSLAIGFWLLSTSFIIGIFWLMIVLIIFGVPIYISMGLVAFIGLYLEAGFAHFLSPPLVSYSALSNYILVCIPLFVLAGLLLERTGSINRIYDMFKYWVRRIPGSAGIVTISSSALFSAISASSMTTALTIGVIAYPELEKQNYKSGFAAALIAAGGTLGPLIPPSGTLIIYAMLTGESLGKLFLAGVFPGILLALLYLLYIFFRGRITLPKPEAFHVTWHQRGLALARALPALGFPIIVLGGIYSGIFTAVECSAVGLLYAFLLMFVKNWRLLKTFSGSLFNTIGFIGPVAAIFAGAMSIGVPINLMRIPEIIVATFQASSLSAGHLIIILVLLFFVMGMIMESMSMMLIFTPFLYPLVIAAGIDPIWYGIFMVIMLEIAVLTPPVGMLLFIIQMVTGVKIMAIIREIWPFVVIILFTVILIWFFPQIALWLPNLVSGG